LTAADVDSHDHVTWVSQLCPSEKVYIDLCINRTSDKLATHHVRHGCWKKS
jgi:hypothetical protein